jgi:hypothetical protein
MVRLKPDPTGGASFTPVPTTGRDLRRAYRRVRLRPDDILAVLN